MDRRESIELTILCIIHRNGKLLLQHGGTPDWQGFAPPGGHVEPGESIVDAVVREMREETGLTVLHPKLCGVKQFPISGGRYLVLLFQTEEFSGALRSSKEGSMEWVSREMLSEYPTVEDLAQLLDVMLRPELTEFQYLVDGDDWQVRMR